ncbi:MAG TPA: nitric oxide synthase oxygenase [Streptosporangiaceae bacterium]
MSLNQDRASGSRRRRQGRKRHGRHPQDQEPVVEQSPVDQPPVDQPLVKRSPVDQPPVERSRADQPPAPPPFLGCPVAMDTAPAISAEATRTEANGAEVNGAEVNGAEVNRTGFNGRPIDGEHANGAHLNGAHHEVPHLDLTSLNWMTLNGTPGNATKPNGHSPNGHEANGHEGNGHEAYGNGANGDGANGSAAKDWAALNRVHGDFVADLGDLPVKWLPLDPDTLALDNLLADAERFIRLFYRENDAGAPEGRIRQMRREIEATGTYRHTPTELEFGARVAWRNSAKCIGRLYWRSLQVRDRREVSDAADVAAESIMHLRKATNGGRIRPVITVFAPDAPGRPGPRILSSQLVRYAGYEREDGSVIGDPANVGITRLAQDLGWAGGHPGGHPGDPGGRPAGRFDVLPLLVQEPGSPATLHELPADAILEVAISHPDYEWFADLGLRWHAVPVISDMYLEIGGVRYPAAPFNGWYMSTEVGARDFGDPGRYDQLPTIAEKMGLSTACDRNLWKDKAMTELNLAVLHSYDTAGVTIADHHTESARFLQHLAKEERQGRACPADWSWIVPPAASSATPVFHRYYQNFDESPNFYRHPAPG